MLFKILINSTKSNLTSSLRSVQQNRLLCLTSAAKQSNQTTSSEKSRLDEEEDNYVKYSKSKASSYKASENFRMASQGPPSQYYFVTLSTIIFLVYFTMLREESDLDQNLYTPWAGNENIYKEILQLHADKSVDTVKINEIKEKIKELEEKISKN